MRFDISVLWIDDTNSYYEETKDILQIYAEDNGISLDLEHLSDPDVFFKRMGNNEKGFKKYDLFFIDYSLSPTVLGSQLIETIKAKKINTDILFYSSQYISEMRKSIKDDFGKYEGVYVAEKTNFEDKAMMLITKNARKLTSLSNIRGFLMDQTSENDFTVKSYILTKYSSLKPEQKKEINDMLLEEFKKRKETVDSGIDRAIALVEDKEICKIKDLFKLPNDALTINIQYRIFNLMISFLNDDIFNDVSVDDYLSRIVKARNTLAHKKLDLCATQEYILYYDTILEYRNRQCPPDCKDHSEKDKYSVNKWNELRKDTLSFGENIDTIQKILINMDAQE